MFCFWRGYLELFARGFDHNFRRFVRMQNLRLDNIKLMKRNKFANARHVHETSAPDYTCTPFAAKFFQPPLATTCFFCSLVLLVCCTPCFASVFFFSMQTLYAQAKSGLSASSTQRGPRTMNYYRRGKVAKPLGPSSQIHILAARATSELLQVGRVKSLRVARWKSTKRKTAARWWNLRKQNFLLNRRRSEDWSIIKGLNLNRMLCVPVVGSKNSVLNLLYIMSQIGHDQQQKVEWTLSAFRTTWATLTGESLCACWPWSSHRTLRK